MRREELLGIAHKILGKALRNGYEESMVLVKDTWESMLKIANSEPSVAQYWDTLSVDLYLVKDKRIIIAGLEPSSIDELDKPLKELLSIAGRFEESPLYAPLPEPARPEPLTGIYDPGIEEALSNPGMLGELVVEAAHRERIDRLAGMIDLKITGKALVTSKGGEYYEESTMMESYLRAFADPDGSGQWSTCSRRLDKGKLEEAAGIAARYAVDSRNRISVEPGVYDIVFSPMIMGNLVATITRMASAFMVYMGMSMFMKHRPGDRVAGESFTLIDDPRLTELPGSTSFDDEGVPTRRKPVIEKGVFKTLLHNTRTAAKMGGETTGNAGWIMPHPWNLVIPPGEASLEELIGEVRKGLLINNNWYTRLQNSVEGVFSTITRDALFLIENGEIKAPVKKIRVADTFPNILQNTELIGRKQYDVKWWEIPWPTRIPYILVRRVHTSKHTA